MENVNRWYFSKDQLANTPSRKCEIDNPRELSYRQQAANFIQDMGQRLQLSQLCINTAIVYMHRFYVFHSFTEVHRNNLSISALFLAAKVEEQPRKLEHVIKVAHVCLHKDAPPLDVRSDAYAEKTQEVVAHENILLQTLGFVLAIEHPHTYVVKVCQLVKASKDLAQTSYIMATTSLHMTTMCLQYKPTVVACVCIHLACKWSSYMIEPCSEGRDWFYYVDRTVTWELLERLTQDFIAILETSPHRFKRKFGKDSVVGSYNPKSPPYSPQDPSLEKRNGLSKKESSSPGPSTVTFDFEHIDLKDYDRRRTKNNNSPNISSTSFRPPTIIHQPSKPVAAPASSTTKEIEKKPLPPPHSAPVVENNIPTKKEPAAEEFFLVSPEVVLSPIPPLNLPVKMEVEEKYPAPTPKLNAREMLPVVSLERVKVKLKPEPVNVTKRESERRPSKHNNSEKVPTSTTLYTSDSSLKEKEKYLSNHTEPTPPPLPQTGIKVKIRKDAISMKSIEPNQKIIAPVVKPNSPKRSLKIKIPRLPPLPPEPAKPPPPPASIKLVLTKDKSGSGSYSTSHKNERSRKRSHGNTNDSSHRNSLETPSKHQKVKHSQKSHSDSHKSSRHRSHGDHSSAAARHSQQVNDSATFHNFNPMPATNYQTYPYGITPPPPPPKLREHNMMVGKTNCTLPLQPPLPPPQPPPPPPPPE